MKKILFLFLCIFLTEKSFSQCDSLYLTADYNTFQDSMPEYYGDFVLYGKDTIGILRLDGKEKSVTLPYKFSYDSLSAKIARAKFVIFKSDGSKCAYNMDLKAKNYKVETQGTGTASGVNQIYTYFSQKDTLLGTYTPPPPKDTSKTKIDTVIVFQDSINYKDVNFYFPNAISPNNDTFNDDFRVFASENVLIDVIEIFDRWGSLRYRQQNIFSDEIHFTEEEKLNQGDCYVGYLIFKNTIKKKFSFSVVRKE
jgi:gliding motility-associated-like protein